MNIKVKIYDKSKYQPECERIGEVEYNNIKGFEIKTIDDEEIYKMGFDEVDEYREYCIITFADGKTATFRNSHIDVFKI